MRQGLMLMAICGALAGCSQAPYRVFAVQVAQAAPADASTDATAAAAAAPPRGAAAKAAGRRAPTGSWPSQNALDLNHCSAAALGRLPGMTPALVAAIMHARPYKAKRELLTRKVLTAAQYAAWKQYLVVHRATTASARARTPTPNPRRPG